MRILVLGATGMLGHKLWEHFSRRYPDTFATVRQIQPKVRKLGILNSDKVIDSVDVNDFEVLSGIMKTVKPHFILNCIGITKRRKEALSAIDTLTVNSLFPHKLTEWAQKNGSARIVNFTTDCVFDGNRGNYSEDSKPNAIDLYGKTKALGEVQAENALTLRSSFIGTELGIGSELFEWFLSQKGEVKGYRNAIYSGLTVLELCRVVEYILVSHPTTSGLYNISSDPISKLDLLMLIKGKMYLDVEIIPDDHVICDRSLDSTKFRHEFGYNPPTWDMMIDELCRDVVKHKEN